MDVAVAIFKAVSTLATMLFGLDAALGGPKTENGRLTPRAQRATLGIVVFGLMALATVGAETYLDREQEKTEAAQFTVNLEGQGRILGQAQVLSGSLLSSLQALSDSLRVSSQILSDSLRSVGTLSQANLGAQRRHLERTVEVLDRLEASNQFQAALLDRQDNAGRQLESVLDDQQRILSEQGLIDRNLTRMLYPLGTMEVDVGLRYALRNEAWGGYPSRLEAKAADLIIEWMKWREEEHNVLSLDYLTNADFYTWEREDHIEITARKHGTTLYVAPSPRDTLDGRVGGLRLDSLRTWASDWFPQQGEDYTWLDETEIRIQFRGAEIDHEIGLHVEQTNPREPYSELSVDVVNGVIRQLVSPAYAVVASSFLTTSSPSLLDLPGTEIVIELWEDWDGIVSGASNAIAIDFLSLTLDSGLGRTLWLGGDRFKRTDADGQFVAAVTGEDIEQHPGEFARFFPRGR